LSYYYPQAAVSLRILFENFGSKSPLSNREHALNITPKRVTVSINDYTKADTFTCELDYKNFPFDPRTIRAAGVTMFIQDQKTTVDAGGNFKQIEPKATTFGLASNAVFVGFADKDAIGFDEDKRTITLEGRDYTSLLIDAPLDKKDPISLHLPLNVAIQQLLAGLEATKQIKVILRGITSIPAIGILDPSYNPLGGKKNKKKNATYWDVIQDLAATSGIIAFIELDKLVLTKPNALYDRTKLKQFVWGKNLSSLNFERKLGRVKDFNVAVRSLDARGKKVVTAKIPEEATQGWSVKTGIPLERVQTEKISPDGKPVKKDANFLAFRLPNIPNKAHLISVGEKIYEEIGRQQIEGGLETKDMCVTEGDVRSSALPGGINKGIEFDVTKIRNGTPIEIHIDQDDIAAIKRTASRDEKVNYLIQRCYEPAIAQLFAETLGKFDTPFYTKAVEFTLDETDGFKMSLDFINFIEIPQSLVSF
jgi:hypothetical protein